MTIKVVGDDNSQVKRATCSNCAAILEYTFNDTRKKTVSDYTGGSDTYRMLTCPRCSTILTVPLH